MARSIRNPKEGTMKKWRETLEKMFMAVSFAESGDHETAISLAGIRPSRTGRLSKAFENVFAAAAFAEAGCPETALGFLGKIASRPGKQSLEIFLQDVGLHGIKVQYGFVTVG
jgi:hypothetical protein